MKRTLAWLPLALLAVLAAGGAWLVVAPFAVGYQARGASWTLATRDDLVAGGVLLGVSLITLGGVVAMTLRARMRRVTAARVADTSRPPTAATVTVVPDGGADPGAPCRLAGTVRSSDTGQPVGEALVTLIDVDGTVVGATPTGPDGRYVFEGLRGGAYTLTAAGRAPVAVGVSVNAGAAETADIAMEPPRPRAVDR